MTISEKQINEFTILDATQAADIFQKVANEGIEHRYVYGSCEDRSHYIYLFLKKLGVEVGKVWAYPPAKYSYGEEDLILVTDPLAISETITWGYHVAPFILVNQADGSVSKMVIDLCFSENGLMPLEEWIGALDCKNLVYNISEGENYLFYSFESVLMRDFTSEPFDFPPTAQEIFNVSYWQLTADDDNIPKDLALNDLAVFVFENLFTLDALEKDYFFFVLSDISYLEFFAMYKIAEGMSETTIEFFSDFYKERFNYWKNKYEYLKNQPTLSNISSIIS